jgi:hypothetical protein
MWLDVVVHEAGLRGERAEGYKDANAGLYKKDYPEL